MMDGTTPVAVSSSNSSEEVYVRGWLAEICTEIHFTFAVPSTIRYRDLIDSQTVMKLFRRLAQYSNQI